MAMATGRIVERFNVRSDVGRREISRLVYSLFDSLLLQTAKKRFHNGVVPAISSPTHAGLKMVRSAEAAPGITAIL